MHQDAAAFSTASFQKRKTNLTLGLMLLPLTRWLAMFELTNPKLSSGPAVRGGESRGKNNRRNSARRYHGNHSVTTCQRAGGDAPGGGQRGAKGGTVHGPPLTEWSSLSLKVHESFVDAFPHWAGWCQQSKFPHHGPVRARPLSCASPIRHFHFRIRRPPNPQFCTSHPSHPPHRCPFSNNPPRRRLSSLDNFLLSTSFYYYYFFNTHQTTQNA